MTLLEYLKHRWTNHTFWNGWWIPLDNLMLMVLVHPIWFIMGVFPPATFGEWIGQLIGAAFIFTALDIIIFMFFKSVVKRAEDEQKEKDEDS